MVLLQISEFYRIFAQLFVCAFDELNRTIMQKQLNIVYYIEYDKDEEV